jgi:hypothetical protein
MNGLSSDLVESRFIDRGRENMGIEIITTQTATCKN